MYNEITAHVGHGLIPNLLKACFSVLQLLFRPSFKCLTAGQLIKKLLSYSHDNGVLLPKLVRHKIAYTAACIMSVKIAADGESYSNMASDWWAAQPFSPNGMSFSNMVVDWSAAQSIRSHDRKIVLANSDFNRKIVLVAYMIGRKRGYTNNNATYV